MRRVADVSPGVRANLPPTAHLRVFSPLRAFDDADQLLIGAQRPLSRRAFEIRARRAVLTRVAREATDPFPHETLESFRVLHEGTSNGTRSMYCPEQLPLRAGMAAGMLQEELPAVLGDVVLPDQAMEAHGERLQEHGMWLDDEPLFTRMSTWGIPLAWFALFLPEDPVELEDADEVLTSARLSTPLIEAIERSASAAATLAHASEDLPLLAEVAEIHQWLLRFHRDSVVELDYGVLARSVWPDDSVADLWGGLEALAEGDLTTAAVAYRRLLSRWQRVRALGRAC